MFAWLKRRRREALRRRPFPPAWQAIIQKNVPYVARLPAADQAELLRDVQVFVAEKHFEGCNGLQLTDEIRVTIAAQACILLLHRETDDYPGLDSILVYPSAYLAPNSRRLPGGVMDDSPQARLGESWTRGVVVLAWDSVLSGAADIHDGHNVVLHEFAHQLDFLDGLIDGTPPLRDAEQYREWHRVMTAEFDRLRADVGQGLATVLDAYGATNPAEFFAVVTETFFEKPRQLRAKHPELYQQLQAFYRQDPAALEGAPTPTLGSGLEG